MIELCVVVFWLSMIWCKASAILDALKKIQKELEKGDAE